MLSTTGSAASRQYYSLVGLFKPYICTYCTVVESARVPEKAIIKIKKRPPIPLSSLYPTFSSVYIYLSYISALMLSCLPLLLLLLWWPAKVECLLNARSHRLFYSGVKNPTNFHRPGTSNFNMSRSRCRNDARCLNF